MIEIGTYRDMPETFAVALLVITGAYGNGEQRKALLKADGYTYEQIQPCVNDILKVMEKYR